ncbi:MAG TPA: YeeE/YedE thiosulfate transporter family protein [Chitinophagales bacterium]|nr:YeeE/YedE thiosulfate transporter family protein [Chitinophagales bacterium]
MLEVLRQPWHWSIAGVLIGLTVPILYLIGNKPFGISSSFRHICAACLPAGVPFFDYDWKRESWNLFFVFGIFLGGVVGSTWLADPNPIKIAPVTQSQLAQLGVTQFTQLEPTDIFSFKGLLTARGFIMIVVGGFLVGFGTRYAGGCTSGHSITGLSNLQLSSLIATICFMLGGFFVTWLVLPLIFKL